MSMFAARVALAQVPIRGVGFGDAFPVVESSVEISVDSTSITITQPAGTITGDLMLINFSKRYDGSSDPPFEENGSSDWTEIWQHGFADGFMSHASGQFYRIRQDGDTTWTFDIGVANQQTAAFVLRISGHDPVNPIGASSFNILLFDNDIVFPGIFTDRTNGLLVHNATTSQSLSGSGFTPPGGFGIVELHDANHGGGTDGHAHAIGTEDFADGGGTGPRTWTTGVSTSDSRGGGWCFVRPILGLRSKLQFELTTDDLLLEDGSFLILEG